MRHKQGRLDEADAYFQQSFAITNEPIVRIRDDYADRLIDRRQFDKAERILRENAAIEAEQVGEDHPLYAECIALLGRCLMLQDRSAEALPLLRQNYEILAKTLGENHPRTSEARVILRNS